MSNNLTYNSSINDASYLHNIEKSIISSMLFNYEIIDDVFETIKHFMFYSLVHQEIVKVIEVLYNNELPIDENFIISRCDNKFKSSIEQALIDIMSVNAITNVNAYCKEVLESYKRREIKKLINTVTKSLMEENIDADSVLSILESEKEKIENLEVGSMDVQTLGEAADGFDKEPALPQIPTGIQWLDTPKCLDGDSLHQILYF